jgi:cell division protein FtsB
MHEINLRSRKKRNIYPRITIFVLFVVFLILIKATWGVFVKNKETRNNLKEVREDFEELKAREVDLRKEIETLGTEKGVDAEVRSKFMVAKEGEGMIVLVDSPEATSTLGVEKSKSFWSRVWGWFR